MREEGEGKASSRAPLGQCEIGRLAATLPRLPPSAAVFFLPIAPRERGKPCPPLFSFELFEGGRVPIDVHKNVGRQFCTIYSARNARVACESLTGASRNGAETMQSFEKSLGEFDSPRGYVLDRRPALPHRLWMSDFLHALRAERGKVIAALASVADAPCRATLYEYRRRNKPFRAAWDRVIAACRRERSRASRHRRAGEPTRRARQSPRRLAAVTPPAGGRSADAVSHGGGHARHER